MRALACSNKDFRPTGTNLLMDLSDLSADRQLLFAPLTKSFPTDVIQEINGSMFVA